jgi:hypothetical protein
MHSIHFYTCLGHEKVKEATVAEYERNVFGPAVSRAWYTADDRPPSVPSRYVKP